MKKRSSKFLVGAILLYVSALSACVPQQRMYEWGSYERSLYNYYKHPDEAEVFTEKLAETLAKAESLKKPPPGLYAEYGYLLLQQGRESEAIEYFKKEKTAWPESELFMDSIIGAIGSRDVKADETLADAAANSEVEGPAPRDEAAAEQAGSAGNTGDSL